MASSELRGQGASPGIAIGPAYVMGSVSRAGRRTLKPVEIVAEIERLRAALAATRAELENLAGQVTAKMGEDQGAIFQAQILMLEDPELRGRAEAKVRERSMSAAWAMEEAGQEAAAPLAAIEDEYLRARADDVRDVASRVIASLLGNDSPGRGDSPGRATAVRLDEPAIVVAEDLLPSDTARIDRHKVLAFVSERGSTTSHAAILARTMGVPAVMGAAGCLRAIRAGDNTVVDGNRGIIAVRPTAAELEVWEKSRQALREEEESALRSADLPAVTRDGYRIDLAANIGSPKDLEVALAYGATEIGLFRTEVLFLDRAAAPSEDEQFEAYREAAEAMRGKRVIIRTLDIGGDKEIPWLTHDREANPFLGLRGIRFCLRHEELFLTQLKALMRARVSGDVWVMLPMIADVREVRTAGHLLVRAARELAAEGRTFAAAPLGIMIEVPAAATMADVLLQEVDFASLGTNDLTQYTLAADRTNEKVAGLADSFHPSVLRQVGQVAAAARSLGKWVGVCGDLAGDPLATPILLGLGVNELSMAAPLLPRVKEAVRRTSAADARKLAAKALQCRDADEVRTLAGTL